MKPLSVISFVMVIFLVACGGASSTSYPNSNSGSSDTSVSDFDRTNWVILATEPDKYKGSRVDIVGQVLAAPERDQEKIAWQMWADPQNLEWNTVVYLEDSGFLVNDGDYVHVKGTVQKGITAENAFGGPVKSLVIKAESAVVVDALAIAPMAFHVYEGAPDIVDQQGLALRIEKVEFAESETRVFVTLTNNSKYETGLYQYESKATQGKTQFNALDTWQSIYPQLHSSLLPGIESSGVIVFPALDPSVETTLYFDVWGGDGSQRFINDDSVFSIPGK